MTSITTSDLNNYTILQLYFKELYDKIKAGKSIVTAGADDFEVFHNKLFPENPATSYTKSTDGLATDTSGLTTINSNAISLKKLLYNTLYPTFHQTINTSLDASTIATDNYTKYSNIHIPNGAVNKEHLCFIKFNAGKTDIEPDNYSITNILYSKYSIEIFIKTIEALKDCYSNYEKQFSNSFSADTKIFIVDKKLNSDHTDNVPKGIFINDFNNELESPPNGIYLYIGNLTNMFKEDDIFIYESGATSTAIAASTKTNYLAENDAIFKPNNKLNNIINNKYYFGFLEYAINTPSTSKYLQQTGIASERRITKDSTSITGSGGATISTKIADAAIRTNLTDITNFKLKSGATIEKVSSTGYKINGRFDGTITGTLTGGTIPSTGNTITAAGTFTLNLQNAGETFDSTTSIKSGTITAGTITSIPVINKPFDSSLILTTISGSFGSGVTLPQTIGAPVTLASDSDVLTLSGSSPITISHAFDTAATITNPTIINAYIEDIKVTTSADNMRSFYKQNIYYTYNFIKMINNINKDSFSTTIKYLHVYLLCYKSLLLASIRAANIFYNNRYDLSALSISYENNFLYNKTPTTNGGCAKTSLNEFIKNDYNALFSTTAACSGTNKLPSDTSSAGTKYKYILYKKKTGATQDNDQEFKEYDVYIQEELDNKNKVAKATSDLGITNFKLFSSFKLKSNFIITSDDTNANDKLNGGIFQNSTPDNEYSYIKDMFDNNKIYNFNKNYRISINGSSFKVVKFNTRKDNASLDRIDIELEHDNSIPTSLFNILNGKTPLSTLPPIPVFIVKITSKDIDRDYNSIVSNTDVVEQNINMYKTKIKNNTTLYELHKSRNNLLYNQVLSYLIIVVIIISILIIINIAGVEKPLVKSITLGCFAVIIILFMSYYIMNTLYIEEGFTISASTNTGYDLCSSTYCKKTEGTVATGSVVNENNTRITESKKQYVKNFLNNNAKELILMIILETPSIVNDSLKGNNEKLVEMSKNIYNEKKYLKDVLYSKKSDAEMNVDVLKYENKNYDVYIICVLFLALIMVGSYTINIYTDNKYLDLLILIMVILFVCLFTYFVLYTNRVVRTVSTNYYWGNEYENEYI